MSIPDITYSRLVERGLALEAQNAALVAAIHEALDYFEDREDVVDGTYGEPTPNKEMLLARVLRDAIKGVRS